MLMNDANDLAILTRVGELFEQLCATIQGDQWDLQTPCSEWKLDQLVDHVTGGNRFTAHILNGESANQAMASTVDSFGSSHQPGKAAILSSQSMRNAFDKQGVLDHLCHHIGGDMPGRVVLRLRLQDIIIHSWDVACPPTATSNSRSRTSGAVVYP